MTRISAFVLAGGRGTRLTPFTDTTPKPMLPFLTEPILFGWLHRLARLGITDTHILAGPDPQPFEPAREHAWCLGLDLTVHTEPSPLHSAGAIRAAATPEMRRILVVNGDVVTDAPLEPLLDHHAHTSAEATLLGIQHPDPTSYGVIRTAGDRITHFIEKPDGAAPAWIYTGVCVLERAILDRIPRAIPWSLERDVFADVHHGPMNLRLHRSAAGWADLGTPARFLAATRRALDRELHWPDPDHSRGSRSGLTVAPDARIHPTATLLPPVIVGHHVTVAAAATVGPHAVVGHNASVGRRAQVRDSIVFPQARVRPNLRIGGTLVDAHDNIAHIARNQTAAFA